MPENYPAGPDQTRVDSAYGEGKRAAEFLCAYYAGRYGIETKIARCFSFVGPGLPLDAHYAIGNFIRDGLKGGPIRVTGDGMPRRSYLYAADLMIWLWTILFKGRSCRAYNAGSEEEVSISDLAHLVARSFDGDIEVRIEKQPVSSAQPDRYVPSADRARAELGLRQTIDLKEAVRRTLLYNSSEP
jgi:nucleoside-diphosphate-sugar epimerase